MMLGLHGGKIEFAFCFQNLNSIFPLLRLNKDFFSFIENPQGDAILFLDLFLSTFLLVWFNTNC